MKTAPVWVLCYHRIAKPEDDPYFLCVSPENFRDHLGLVRRRADIVSIDEIATPSTRPRVVITFDDGYADNLELALPVAESLDAPMTVYVTSGAIGSDIGFWWDRLAAVIDRVPEDAPELVLPAEDGPFRVKPDSMNRRGKRGLYALHKRLRHREPQEVNRLIDLIAQELDISHEPWDDCRPLTRDQLDDLAASSLVTIGAHTVDHALLSSCTFEAQLDTMLRSRNDLEKMIGQNVDHFAYPFGGKDAVNDDAVHAAQEAGFLTSATTSPGKFGRRQERLRVPRRLVMNWPARRFDLQLTRWGLF